MRSIGMNVVEASLRQRQSARGAATTALNRKEIVDAALFGAGVPGGPLSPALKDPGRSM